MLAQIPGTVTVLHVAEGIAIAKGQPLATILAPDIVARHARVRAERRRVERERDFACRQLRTDRVLAQSGDVTSVFLDRSKKNCSSARLAVTAAKAGEREVLVIKKRDKELAPFDGQVLMHRVDIGQTVMPGTPLMTFGSKALRMRLRIPAADLDDVEVGSHINTQHGKLTVDEIRPLAMGPGRLVDVFADLDAATALRIGSSHTVTIVQAQITDACKVPKAAIGRDKSGTYVLLLDGESLLRKTVMTGLNAQGWIAIEPALAPGSKVVIGRVEGLDLSHPVLAVMP